ncbi:MAG: class A beta-lactamase-related serine hydrolase [Vicinamibacteria bacterium]|nr:class A beta-lactamase-related serine hydrolase [Vicinamibacteria bacterium]
MNSLLPILAMTLATASQTPASPDAGKKSEPEPFSSRRQAAVKIIGESGAEVSVAYRLLDGSEEWMHEADRVFHAASTMKVPVMIELFRQESQKQLSLSDTLEIRNEFRSVVDGSLYAMNMGDDSDATVYRNIGKTMTLEELNAQMITVSSNFATNLLIDRLGVRNVRATVESLGAYGVEVRRGVEDQKAFDQGIINETTARGLFVLMNAIARGTAVSKGASERMVEVLAGQKFNDGIPQGVPPGTKVAHKTGTITRVHHDAGIVYGARPCVLVILTRGIDKEADSDALIARITRALLP